VETIYNKPANEAGLPYQQLSLKQTPYWMAGKLAFQYHVDFMVKIISYFLSKESP
jgi:hypothetical protein